MCIRDRCFCLKILHGRPAGNSSSYIYIVKLLCCTLFSRSVYLYYFLPKGINILIGNTKVFTATNSGHHIDVSRQRTKLILPELSEQDKTSVP